MLRTSNIILCAQIARKLKVIKEESTTRSVQSHMELGVWPVYFLKQETLFLESQMRQSPAIFALTLLVLLYIF